jgi:16S rRNA (adenine1518-N6/adenine1519-N6)-dimethyltransferase
MKQPFGQHFLFDKNILRKIISCGNVTQDDTVVEVGPGLGPLTSLLADSAKKVIAIEFDKRLIERLTENLSDKKNVEIVSADALKYPYDSIRGKFKVVANIPYNITTPLIFKFLEYKKKVTSMTLLMQKEVAKRIVAPSGTGVYGVLSISLQFQTKPDLKFTVSRKAFYPPPKVDSAVVHFDIPQKPLYKVNDDKLFLQVVKSAFSQRRKTIINSLKAYQNINEALIYCKIDKRIRPEQLSIEQFAALANNLK